MKKWISLLLVAGLTLASFLSVGAAELMGPEAQNPILNDCPGGQLYVCGIGGSGCLATECIAAH